MHLLHSAMVLCDPAAHAAPRAARQSTSSLDPARGPPNCPDRFCLTRSIQALRAVSFQARLKEHCPISGSPSQESYGTGEDARSPARAVYGSKSDHGIPVSPSTGQSSSESIHWDADRQSTSHRSPHSCNPAGYGCARHCPDPIELILQDIPHQPTVDPQSPHRHIGCTRARTTFQPTPTNRCSWCRNMNKD